MGSQSLLLNNYSSNPHPESVNLPIMNALRLSVPRSAVRSASSFNARRAAFSMSARSMAGKEDKLHSEGRAEEIEKKKQGKQHWEDELASNSESAVKADRGETGADPADTIEKLQEESVKAAKSK